MASPLGFESQFLTQNKSDSLRRQASRFMTRLKREIDGVGEFMDVERRPAPTDGVEKNIEN